MALVIWLLAAASLGFGMLNWLAGRAGKSFWRLATRILAALCFVLVGFLCLARPSLGLNRLFYPILILPGLLASLLGDLALSASDAQPRHRERMHFANWAFLAAQGLYALAIFFAGGPSLGPLVLALGLYIAFLLFYSHLKADFEPMKLRIQLLAGGAALLAGSAAFAPQAGGLLGALLLLAGFSLPLSFAALGYALLGRRHTAAALTVHAFCYYGAQVLLALSLWLR
ncbi:MAG: lysoplasmalogenase family protein [Christensenellaceae bacterium]|jgi:hypothetical protein|nr:lysoplasmalogenase family protein [Christensenellaceae bacterium]